jgi:hypothetical protein
MNFPKTFQTSVCGALFVSSVLLGHAAATPKPRAQAWGEVVSGLQMRIYRDQAESVPGKAPRFRVELRDAGENELVLNLGLMLDNARKQYPNAVFLILTDALGRSRRFDLLEPAVIAGRADPFVVPLPVGATFSIPVDLDKYWAAKSKDFDYNVKPGTYSLEAEFTGRAVSQQEANLDVKGIALMPCWTGTVTSNQLRFEVPNQ